MACLCQAHCLFLDPFESSPPAKSDAASHGSHEKPVKAVSKEIKKEEAKPIPGAGKADFAVGGPFKNAVDTLKVNMWHEISDREHQPIIAASALVVGLVGLIDGRRFFRMLVLLCFSLVAFCVTLTQVETTAIGHNMLAKYFVSMEVALLAGYTMHKGWEGTQLLLGSVLGLFIFHTVQGLAALVPNVDVAAHHSYWILSVGTLCVAIGIGLVHDKRGGSKFLGLFASLFGSSLVVATIGYLSMLACTVPDVAKSMGVSFKATDVPCLFEFWNMLAFPMTSQAVGFFTSTHRDLNIGKHSFDLDRILSLFFWAVFSFVATRYQIRKARAEQSSDMLKVRLLSKEEAVQHQNAPRKAEV